MNNRQLYLAWLRTAAPTVYTAAIRKATGQTKNLGGLDSDLLQQALSPGLRHSFLGDDGTDMDSSSSTFSASDLTDTSAISFDPIVFTPPVFDPGTVTAPTPLPTDSSGNVVTAAPTASPSIFSSVLQAVTSIGNTVVNASQTNALIALNTQRAAQGLPPVNAQGQVVTAAGTATTSAGLLALENAISRGSGSSLIPMLLIGGLILYLVMGRNPRPSAA
jgi:hypothetical protein